MANRMPPSETVVPRIVASPVRQSTRVAMVPVKLNVRTDECHFEVVIRYSTICRTTTLDSSMSYIM